MINSHILIIHKFPILFSILNEIKSILIFDIEILNDNKIDVNSIERNIVIISGKKKIEFKNQINIENFPVNITKLIEMVNIQFLKNKFNEQSDMKIGKYRINLNSRIMTYENKSLSLTEKETKIINFLNKSNDAVSIVDLQTEVWGHKSKLDTHTVETHVYRLRKKVENKFNDKKFILSFKNGYKI